MRRALQRLPPSELERIGIDFTSPILEGTPRAEALHEAWIQRQREFKAAVETLVKPAEHMAKLSQILTRSNATHFEVSSALGELESLLADVDNARDFYTIGGWPILVSLLHPSRTIEHRSLAAWAVGTAIKNSYDYQLWVLEEVSMSIPTPIPALISTTKPTPIPASLPASSDVSTTTTTADGPLTSSSSSGTTVTSTCLDLLVTMLHVDPPSSASSSSPSSSGEVEVEVEVDAMWRKSMYALSAAVRGNSDVQQALLSTSLSTSSPSASTSSSSSSSFPWSLEVTRKVWSLVGDLLQERQYLRVDLPQEWVDARRSKKDLLRRMNTMMSKAKARGGSKGEREVDAVEEVVVSSAEAVAAREMEERETEEREAREEREEVLLQQQEREAVSSTVLLGDALCSDDWLLATTSSLSLLLPHTHSHTHYSSLLWLSLGDKQVTEAMGVGVGMDVGDVIPLRAILHSLSIVLQQLMTQCPSSSSFSLGMGVDHWRETSLAIAKHLTQLLQAQTHTQEQEQRASGNNNDNDWDEEEESSSSEWAEEILLVMNSVVNNSNNL